MWLWLFKAESSSKDLLDRDVARWKMKRCRGWQSYSVWWGDDPIEPCYLLVCQDSFRTVWRRTYILSWNRDRISLVPGLVRHCIKCCITKLIHQLLRRLIVAIKYCRDEIGNADNRSFASSPDICVWRRSRTGQIAFRLAINFYEKSLTQQRISLCQRAFSVPSALLSRYWQIHPGYDILPQLSIFHTFWVAQVSQMAISCILCCENFLENPTRIHLLNHTLSIC